jgi:hypothetical protein
MLSMHRQKELHALLIFAIAGVKETTMRDI